MVNSNPLICESFSQSSQTSQITEPYICSKAVPQSVQKRSNFNSNSTGNSSSPIQYRNYSSANNQSDLISNEFLSIDFMTTAAEWFDYVNSETKSCPEMSHSIRKFNFLLDCDGSARKVIFFCNIRAVQTI